MEKGGMHGTLAGEQHLDAMIDTGATHCIVPPSIAPRNMQGFTPPASSPALNGCFPSLGRASTRQRHDPLRRATGEGGGGEDLRGALEEMRGMAS